MGILSGREFGVLIAYVVPGFIALGGASTGSEAVANWFLGANQDGPTVGGAVYLLVASVGAGMTASAARWMVLDRLHAMTGLARPVWDDALLEQRRSAYELLIEIHYRYYQFYGNTLVATVFAVTTAAANQIEIRIASWVTLAFLVAVFVTASRDALSNYYRRVSRLLADERTSHDKRWTPRQRRARRRAKERRSQKSEHEHAGGTEDSASSETEQGVSNSETRPR